VVIDTSAHDASNASSIEGAHQFPQQAISPISLAKLAGADKFTPVVFFDMDANSIHCYKAVRQAVILGYSNVYWFRGGLKEWLNKGLPVVRVQ
jgi:rhodanese-related sulfurtransferase